ncbi:MAG TPA: hypothetical protein VJ083_09050 [Sedimentibacter sp.]|nr:hypothetical protein [Sedimentibacter sp.]
MSVVNLCEVLICAGMSEKCMNDIYNIGGNDELSIREMAEVIANIYSVNVKPIEWPEMAFKLESWDTVFDSKKLNGLMVYSYQYNFKDWAQEQKVFNSPKISLRS